MNGLLRMLDRQGFVVLDGGLATTLAAAGHPLDATLWSARLLLDTPDAVRAAHLAFLEAGADCISTATYQATLSGLARAGLTAGDGAALLRSAVEIARDACDALWADPVRRAGRIEPIVAASVGPYGAFLADGSEYDGRYGISREALADFHRPRLEILAGSGADVLALETIPSGYEVEVLIELLRDVGHPGAWLSFSCRDAERLWDGTPVEDAARACDPDAGVVAVGVNCTAPEHVGSLVKRMREATDLAILAYPNSGETYEPSNRSWSGRPAGEAWLARLPDWVGAGARAVGGCCRVGPGVIRGVRRRLEELLAKE